MTGLTLSADHKYTLDGRPVPGVTQVLKEAGLVNADWATQWHLERGQAIHAAAEYIVRGTLDWSTVDERIRPYLDALQKFLKDSDCELATAAPELFVHSARHRYAGRLDLVAKVFGEWTVCDWKSGAVGPAGPQTAAYEMAYREERGITKLLKRIAVQLKPDGKYKMKELADFSDYLDWLACLERFRTKDGE